MLGLKIWKLLKKKIQTLFPVNFAGYFEYEEYLFGYLDFF